MIIKIKMRGKMIVLCLAIIYCAQAVVILQSTTSTNITSPTGQSTLYSAYYNTNRKNFAGSGVQWITSSKTNSQTRFQNLFYANCVGSANISIAAVSSFNAYLDGVFIGSGNNASKLYTFARNITCGRHNLTIIIYRSGNALPGLTFIINQDQSKCFKCEVTGYWSQSLCSCQCIASPCACTAPKIWKTYPICGCGCPPLRLLAEQKVAAEAATKEAAAPAIKQAAASAQVKAAAQASAAAALRIVCLYPRYYNLQTCSCTCHYAYCPSRTYFDQKVCDCLPIIY